MNVATHVWGRADVQGTGSNGKEGCPPVSAGRQRFGGVTGRPLSLSSPEAAPSAHINDGGGGVEARVRVREGGKGLLRRGQRRCNRAMRAVAGWTRERVVERGPLLSSLSAMSRLPPEGRESAPRERGLSRDAATAWWSSPSPLHARARPFPLTQKLRVSNSSGGGGGRVFDECKYGTCNRGAHSQIVFLIFLQ